MLDLGNNKIGDEGATAIAEALHRNTVLTELSLWGNNIGNKGATAITKALQRNSVLKYLNLHDNKIDARTKSAIQSTLRMCSEKRRQQKEEILRLEMESTTETVAAAAVTQHNTPLFLESQPSTENQLVQLDNSLNNKKEDEFVVSSY